MRPIALLLLAAILPNFAYSQDQKSSATDNSIAVNANNNSKVNINLYYTDPKSKNKEKEIDTLKEELQQKQTKIEWLELNPIKTILKASAQQAIESLPEAEKRAHSAGNSAPAIAWLEERQVEAEHASKLASKSAASYAFEAASLSFDSNRQKAIKKLEEAVQLDPDNFSYNVLLISQIFAQLDDPSQHSSWKKCSQLISAENSKIDKSLIAFFYLIQAYHRFDQGKFSAALASITQGSSIVSQEISTRPTQSLVEVNILLDTFRTLILAISREVKFNEADYSLQIVTDKLEARLKNECQNCRAVWHQVAGLKLGMAKNALDSRNLELASNLLDNIAKIAISLDNQTNSSNRVNNLLNQAQLARSRLEFLHGNIPTARVLARNTINNALAGQGDRSIEDLIFALEAIEHAIMIERTEEVNMLEIDAYKNIAVQEVLKQNNTSQVLILADAKYILASIFYYADDASDRLEALKSAEQLIKKNVAGRETIRQFYLQKKIRYALLRTIPSDTSNAEYSQQLVNSWREDFLFLKRAEVPTSSNRIEEADILFEQARHNGTYISCRSARTSLENAREIFMKEWDRNSIKSAPEIASRIDETFEFELACTKDKSKRLEVAKNRFAFAQIDYLNGNNHPYHHVFSANSELIKQIIINNKSPLLNHYADTFLRLTQRCSEYASYEAACADRQGQAYLQLAVFTVEDQSLSKKYYSMSHQRFEKAIDIAEKMKQLNAADSARINLISALTIEASQYPKKIDYQQATTNYQRALTVYFKLMPKSVTKPMTDWQLDLASWIKSRSIEPFSIEPWNYYGQLNLTPEQKLAR
jgi:hypothetical protein